MELKIEKRWENLFNEEFCKDYFLAINRHILQEKSKGKIVYPPENEIFNAFNLCPLERLKVVILGQDPYHKPELAMGLSFSVPKDQRIPPSLRNIFKEIHNDLGIVMGDKGDLSPWAEQGVLLLNSILTVRHKSPGSHQRFGWQKFTDHVIQKLSEMKDHLVFILWGNYAKSKREIIDAKRHLILESVHPSPFTRGKFFGNNHFSRTNEYLRRHKITPINWGIKDQ